MKKYTAAAALTFGPGTKLELSAAQAIARAHALEAFKADAKVPGKPVAVVTKAAVQFKVGEVIGVDGDLPKSLLDVLIPVAKPQEEK